MNAVPTLPKGWVQVPYLNVVWDVCVQAHTDSCATACVAMAVNHVDGSHPTERAVMTNEAGFMSECRWVIKDPATENRVGVGTTVPYCAVDHGLRTIYSTSARVMWYVEEVVIVGRNGTIPF